MKSKTSKSTSSHSKTSSASVRKSNKQAKKDVLNSNISEESYIIKIIYMLGGALLFIGLTFALLLLTSACTYSINNVQTEGKASDVVDETQTNEPDISPTLSLPLSI